jgi:HNH endonuclease
VADCIPWQKYVRADGYGLAWDPIRKAMRMAHRVAFEKVYGPLPDDIELDHTCHTPDCRETPCLHRRCVEITHLEQVDRLENNRRGRSWKWRTEITHCPAGHPHTPENTGRQVNRRGTPRESVVRYCRRCKRDKSREQRRR